MLHNYLAKLWGSILSGVLFPFTAVNNWSIRHPYQSAGALLLISARYDPTMFGILLHLTRKTMLLCFLPVRLIIRRFAFGSQGVEKGSFASWCRSHRCGGNVLRGSGFAELQSYGATMPTATSPLVSLLSYTGALIILGREWRRLVRLRGWYRIAVEM
ncbi:hypothetical protein CY34DRAFT_803741 [Suillus luteus UH-Slu-Lm8-n1]|uniref:Uncharacterized protein n=1 Tax=Suillus luteus UH-Slu-Lm8-n1 TaxID=930992 RepID=A0A0D0ANX0_9AGAM|nr:hypothetical protein CY34DRAFT_803741 [Suillus luteus UH-Slu-Lm8-n1]